MYIYLYIHTYTNGYEKCTAFSHSTNTVGFIEMMNTSRAAKTKVKKKRKVKETISVKYRGVLFAV